MMYQDTQSRPITPAIARESREPQIQVCVIELERTITQLHESIEALEMRLSPILAITPPQGVANAKEGPRVAAPALAESLRTSRDRVFQADARLRELASRVEV